MDRKEKNCNKTLIDFYNRKNQFYARKTKLCNKKVKKYLISKEFENNINE